MSPEETTHAARFYFQADRDRFIAGRGGLRRILANYCRIDAADLIFQTDAHGKPALSDSPIEFNISHAGDCVLIGITTGAKCGVDIERLHARRSVAQLVDSLFCPREIEWLHRTECGFLRLWTMKEAVIKAIGCGLSIPLLDIDVSDVAEGRTFEITLECCGLESSRLWLKELVLIPGYVTAIATVGPEHAVRLMPQDNYF